MALHHFHYLVTCFGLTVWTHAPFLVLGIYAAFQAIIYIAGIDVPDYDDFIFWQFITALAGVLLGWALLIVTRAPRFLRFDTSYVGTWGQFIVWFLLYLATQLFYAFFPPPAYPFGIVGTAVCHLILTVGLWVVMMYNPIIFGEYRAQKYLFMLWAFVLLAVELTFFIAYVLLERWTAYIATGVGAAILVVAALAFPLKDPYRKASGVAGEPLIGATPGKAPGDGEDEAEY